MYQRPFEGKDDEELSSRRMMEKGKEIDAYLVATGDAAVLEQLEMIVEKHRPKTVLAANERVQDLLVQWRLDKHTPTQAEAKHAIDLMAGALHREAAEAPKVTGIRQGVRWALSWVGVTNKTQFQAAAGLLAEVIKAAASGGTVTAADLVSYAAGKLGDAAINAATGFVFAEEVGKAAGASVTPKSAALPFTPPEEEPGLPSLPKDAF